MARNPSARIIPASSKGLNLRDVVFAKRYFTTEVSAFWHEQSDLADEHDHSHCDHYHGHCEHENHERGEHKHDYCEHGSHVDHECDRRGHER